jgi:hypothetical protein
VMREDELGVIDVLGNQVDLERRRDGCHRLAPGSGRRSWLQPAR